MCTHWVSVTWKTMDTIFLLLGSSRYSWITWWARSRRTRNSWSEGLCLQIHLVYVIFSVLFVYYKSIYLILIYLYIYQGDVGFRGQPGLPGPPGEGLQGPPVMKNYHSVWSSHINICVKVCSPIKLWGVQKVNCWMRAASVSISLLWAVFMSLIIDLNLSCVLG